MLIMVMFTIDLLDHSTIPNRPQLPDLGVQYSFRSPGNWHPAILLFRCIPAFILHTMSASLHREGEQGPGYGNSISIDIALSNYTSVLFVDLSIKLFTYFFKLSSELWFEYNY